MEEEVESWENSGWKWPQEVSSPTSFSKQHYIWEQTRLLRAFSIWVLKTSKEPVQLWETWCCAWLFSWWKSFSPSWTPHFNSHLLSSHHSLESTDWLYLPDSLLIAVGPLGLLGPNSIRYLASFLFSRLKKIQFPQPLITEHMLQHPVLMAPRWTHSKYPITSPGN